MARLFAWAAAVVFGLGSFGMIIAGKAVAGLFGLGVACMALPPLWDTAKARGANVPVWSRWAIAIVMLAIMGSLERPPSETTLPATQPTSASSSNSHSPAASAIPQTAEDAGSKEDVGSWTTQDQDTGSWRYGESSDAMHDTKTKTACTTSTNDAQLSPPYQNVPADLCLRRSPRFGLDAYVQLEGQGQMLCGIEGCSLRVRFDKAPITTFPAAEAADYSSNILFIRRTSSFISALRRSSSTVVEVTFYRDGVQQLTFDTSHLNWN